MKRVMLLCCVSAGSEEDGGVQGLGAEQSRWQRPALDLQSEENESHLSHTQPVQHRHHPKAHSGGDLVSCLRSDQRPECSDQGLGQFNSPHSHNKSLMHCLQTNT